MQIELGWPAKALSPNFRCNVHWPRTRALAAAKKEAHGATLAAMMRGCAPKWAEQRIAFIITAYPPDKRERDDDNLVSSCKASRDGIALALGIDDSRFDLRPLQWGEPVKNGKIIITLEAAQ